MQTDKPIIVIDTDPASIAERRAEIEQQLEQLGEPRPPRKSGAQRRREENAARVELSRLRAAQRRRGVAVPTDLNGGALANIPRGRQGVARERAEWIEFMEVNGR
jgi:hypothetical protein